MGGQLWEVVGGSDKGGIVVRTGRELTSSQTAERLSKSAVVEELERHGDRLHYKRLTGTGPIEGWVSLRLKDKILLEPRSGDEFKSAKPATIPKTTNTPNPKSAAQRNTDQAEKPNVSADSHSDYQMRLARLKKRYAHLELDVPYEAYKWRPEELDNFFESGGFIKPVKTMIPEQRPKQERKTLVTDIPQISINEASEIQNELIRGFSHKDFQQSLKTLQANHPNRKSRGHADGAAYFESFEALTMIVYYSVLPKVTIANLTLDWNGVNDMFAMMQSAMNDRKIKKNMEEINDLLGLPRDAVFKPNAKVKTFVFHPKGDAPILGFAREFVQDDDGDEAHEFLVEDPSTGELCKAGRSALDEPFI